MSTSPDIFLSYNRDDQVTARRFAESLEREGFSVWWDATLRTGESYDQVTEKALNDAKAVVVLWSKKSVDSRWVRAEATMADRNKTLAPVMIEACQRPIMFELTHTADLSHWTGDAKDKPWRSFVDDLRQFVQKVVPERTNVSTDSRSRAATVATPWYRGRNAVIAIPSLVIVIAATLLYLFLRPQGVRESTRALPETSAATPPTPSPAARPVETAPNESRTSVAVLPFANLTGDATKEYFGDGMAEELIDALAHIPGLKVPARISSFAYKGRDTDIKKIAQDLGVGSILEGSVRSAGDRIRVTAQLVDAKTGYNHFSQTYDRKFADIFKLQDELARSIVMALREGLTENKASTEIQGPPTHDAEAYRLYLQAGSVANGTEQGYHYALTLLDQAIGRDPQFARAFASRSGVREAFILLGFPLPNALADAERDASQALALDPNLGYAHRGLGTTYAFRGNWLKAETSYRAAFTADKTDPGNYLDHTLFILESAGRLQQGLSELSEAYRLAPALAIGTSQLAGIYSMMGRDAEAVKFADMAVAMGINAGLPPLYQTYANAARRSGRYAEAADRLAAGLSPAMRSAGGVEVLKLMSAAQGDPTKKLAALQALQHLEQKLASGNLDVSLRKDFMQDFTLLGALDQAYDMANQSLDEYARDGTVGSAWGALWVPEMRPFRQDPRFQGLVTRLKLMEYWRQYGPPDDCSLKDDRLTCH